MGTASYISDKFVGYVSIKRIVSKLDVNYNTIIIGGRGYILLTTCKYGIAETTFSSAYDVLPLICLRLDLIPALMESPSIFHSYQSILEVTRDVR